MKRLAAAEATSTSIDARINRLGDWRGKTLKKVRKIVHEADPEIVEDGSARDPCPT